MGTLYSPVLIALTFVEVQLKKYLYIIKEVKRGDGT